MQHGKPVRDKGNGRQEHAEQELKKAQHGKPVDEDKADCWELNKTQCSKPVRDEGNDLQEHTEQGSSRKHSTVSQPMKTRASVKSTQSTTFEHVKETQEGKSLVGRTNFW